MARRNKPVTIDDIAERTGVSRATVSKALNGRGQLRQATRELVLDAARELGFRQDAVGRELVAARTYTVGLITTDSYGRFTVPILTGAEDALALGEISMLLCESREDPIRERHYLRTLIARRVDGIIVTGRSSDARPSIGREFPVPVVYALARSADPDDYSVVPDDEGGAKLAIEHLIEIGRRNVAVVAGPTRHVASQHRVAGATAALAAAGLTAVVGEALYGQWSERWGRQAARRLIESGQSFDAAFCASDQIARGFTDELREAGVRCPEDVAVVGVDNWDVMVEASRPPLTTIDLGLRELGKRAASVLLGAIDGHPVPRGTEYVDCHLVVRGSTVA
jgi:LacI family transcriptional regulator